MHCNGTVVAYVLSLALGSGKLCQVDILGTFIKMHSLTKKVKPLEETV